jgi:membrane-bound ClpP family serine protease
MLLSAFCLLWVANVKKWCNLKKRQFFGVLIVIVGIILIIAEAFLRTGWINPLAVLVIVIGVMLGIIKFPKMPIPRRSGRVK